MRGMLGCLSCLAAVAVVCGLMPGCAQPATTPETPRSEEAVTPTPPEEAPAPDNPADALKVSHRLSPEAYKPGEEIEVVVDMDYVGDDPITALAIQQVVPAGWEFVAVTGGIQPDVSHRDAELGAMDFVWITTPDWPNNFSYALRPPEDARGDAKLTGQGIYRTSGPELRTTPVEVPIPAGS